MNWFNIVLILVMQSFIFWEISQIYERKETIFQVFKAMFLLSALLNIVLIALLSLSVGNSSPSTFNGYAEIIVIFQLLIMGIIIFSYGIYYFMGSVDLIEKI